MLSIPNFFLLIKFVTEKHPKSVKIRTEKKQFSEETILSFKLKKRNSGILNPKVTKTPVLYTLSQIFRHSYILISLSLSVVSQSLSLFLWWPWPFSFPLHLSHLYYLSLSLTLYLFGRHNHTYFNYLSLSLNGTHIGRQHSIPGVFDAPLWVRLETIGLAGGDEGRETSFCKPTTSVTSKKSPNVYKSCPKWFH